LAVLLPYRIMAERVMIIHLLDLLLSHLVKSLIALLCRSLSASFTKVVMALVIAAMVIVLTWLLKLGHIGAGYKKGLAPKKYA
jgi:hypothetical protein